MEINSSSNFIAMTNDEENQINGGGLHAAVYALGFVMGMSPLGALCVCGTCIVGGVVTAYLVSK